ncbi:MAG: hypothetical protein WB660_02690 [Candidatus Sulfotelmatobacter sp.]
MSIRIHHTKHEMKADDYRYWQSRPALERITAPALADYQAQADKPFDHDARMKDLLMRQAQLNAALDLDKNETQVAPA